MIINVTIIAFVILLIGAGVLSGYVLKRQALLEKERLAEAGEEIRLKLRIAEARRYANATNN